MSSIGLDDLLLPEFDLAGLQLDQTSSEDPYLQGAFELAKEVACHAAVAASAHSSNPPVPAQRNEMIARGHMARITRLLRSAIRQIVDDHGGDQQLPIFRQVLDSASTVAYLLEGGIEHGDRMDAYVLDSLIAEREFARDVANQIDLRGNVRLPIEDRILASMTDTTLAAGVEDLDAVPSRRRNAWPSIETRIGLLGPVAYSAYRMGSGALHGSFAEIEKNYWTSDRQPDLSPSNWRPQSLLTTGLISLQVCRLHVATYLPAATPDLEPLWNRLEVRLRKLDELHESFLQKRREVRIDDDASGR